MELEKVFSDVLEPYTAELGRLLHNWNDLHIALTYLFLAISQSDPLDGNERDLFLAIWNAVPNDRLQRQMLKRVAEVRFSRISNRMAEDGIIIDAIQDHEAMLLTEVIWIVDSSNVLGRKRDDSAHLPVTLFYSGTLMLIPDDETGHPIAQALKDKDILAEFNLTRSRVSVVRNHAWAVERYLTNADGPLPQRPVWPASLRPSKHKDGKAV